MSVGHVRTDRDVIRSGWLCGAGVALPLYFALLSHANADGECFPGTDKLIEECTFEDDEPPSDRTMTRWRQTLIARGYIRSAALPGGTGSLRYVIVQPGGALTPPTEVSRVDRSVTPRVDTNVTSRVDRCVGSGVTDVSTKVVQEKKYQKKEGTPLPLDEAVDQTSLIEIDSREMPTTQSKKYEYDPDYLVFYEAYPRKAGKRAGEKSYKAWRKKRVYSDAQGLLKLLAPYIVAWDGRTEDFLPHPGSWINTMPWDQEPPKPPGSVVTEQAVESDDANYLYATEVPLDMIDVETDAIVGEMIRDPARDSDTMDSVSYDMHIEPMRGVGRTDDGSIIIAFPKNDDAWHAEREYLDHMTDLLGHKPKLTCVYWEMQKRKDGVDA